ncbi:MAG: hypothetical protein V1846_03935 [Candidatus Komeilibacteria bacterium]
MESFKLAVLSDEFSDDEVLYLFLDQEVGSEAEVRELPEFLDMHRPQIVSKIAHYLCYLD